MNIKLRQGILISFISFMSGGIATYFITDYIRLKSSEKQLSSVTKNNIVKQKRKTNRSNNDPFDQMDKVHAQVQKRMDKLFGKTIGSPFFDIAPVSGSSFTTNNIKINRYEDDDYKYIEIAGEGVNQDLLQVNISGGLISISGEIKQTGEDNNSSSISRSSYISKFNQSFNVPQGVDEANVKMESKENKLIIKFPKERI